jgi:hypothetical protein
MRTLLLATVVAAVLPTSAMATEDSKPKKPQAPAPQAADRNPCAAYGVGFADLPGHPRV